MAYTNVANISAYLRTTIDSSTTPSQTQVEQWIAEADNEIDRITKSTYETTTVTDEIIPTNSYNSSISNQSFDDTGAYNQPAPSDKIGIGKKNVLTLTAVAYNTAADGETPVWEDLTIGHGSDCVLDGDNIKILKQGLIILRRHTGLKISYTYGADSVPAFVAGLATKMTALSYMNSGLSNEVSGGGGSIRVGDIQITEPGAFSQAFIKSSQDWVDNKLKQLGVNNVYII